MHLNEQPQRLIVTVRETTEILMVSGEVLGWYNKSAI